MKIVIENHIPYIKGVFEPFANVVYLPSDRIDRREVSDADALIVRTRTRCDARLLDGSRCKLVATATIGTDHIDMEWCRNNGVEVVNAPGCNAPAVAQYVLSSLLAVESIDRLRTMTLGIVGVGHVGSIVRRWAEGLGINVIVNDPPKADAGLLNNSVSLDEIAEKADIVTFHTPSTSSGPYATYHLANAAFFNSLKRCPIIINSARGPVADTAALIDAIDNGTVSNAVIDCWENEPDISTELLQRAIIATPHIAGYSAAGKIRATVAVVETVASRLHIPAEFAGNRPPVPPAVVTPEMLMRSYNPVIDTNALKAAPADFEYLRNNYELRREP